MSKDAPYREIAGFQLGLKRIGEEKYAEGPTLIFLHHALGSISTWRDFPERLCEATGLSGLLYDRRGHGRSSPFSARKNGHFLEEEATVFLPKLLQEEGIEKPVLIGHSDGATIALLFEAHFQQAAAIVNLAGHICNEEKTRQGIQEQAKILARPEMGEKLRRHHGTKADQLVEDWMRIWTAPGFSDWNISELLPRIQCPVLVVQGEEDEYATVNHFQEMVELPTGPSTGVLLPQTGHFPHFEKTKETIDLIHHFLNHNYLLP